MQCLFADCRERMVDDELSICRGGQIGLGHGFGIFGSVERIIRVLLAQLAQQILREGILLPGVRQEQA